MKSFLLSIVFVSGMLFAQKMTTEEYIRKYKDWAVENMKLKKVPASITLAQGILESGSGNSSLATGANNHFGIKCHKGWNGATYHMDDDAPNECFRKYKSVLESYNDHADFLSGRERYQGLFALEITDYKGWANGLKAAGYATNPKYATLLIDLIEKYKLYEYDQLALQIDYLKEDKANDDNSDNNNSDKSNNVSSQKGKLIYINGLRAIRIVKGQSKNDIAAQFELKTSQLNKYNELGDADELYEGELIFLDPKRVSAEPAYKYHMVKEGDTFYSIAHQYGMKTEALMKKNNMWYGSVIKPGDKLSLRKKVRTGN